jgi:hypothetical protein
VPEAIGACMSVMSERSGRALVLGCRLCRRAALDKLENVVGRPGCTSRGLTAAVVSVSLLLMTSAATARAATFAVTRFDDPSLTGPCRPGNCSLREAIRAAGLAHGTNTILAPKGTYTLSLPNQPLEVVGATETIKAVHGQVTIDANGTTTDTLGIHVLSGGHLTLDNVIEEHGIAPVDTDGIARGGGIRVDQGGSLTMNGGGVLFNVAKGEGAEGGGIYSNGQLTLNGVGVADDMDSGTPSFGGAIFTDSHGATTVIDSEFFSNAAVTGGGFAGTGTLDVSRSLIDDNKADEGGGAAPGGCAGDSFTYDTFASNDASNFGGAIYDADASVILEHDTISTNSADQGGGGFEVANLSGGCPTDFFLRDSIIAGNSGSEAFIPSDCGDGDGSPPPAGEGDITSQGHNIVGDDRDCDLTPAGGDLIGASESPIDPDLGPLQNNGGQTLTMALLPGSPAIGGANPSRCGTTDQRGYVIAHDGDKGGCDIGAYEVFLPPKLKAAPQITGNRQRGSRLSCSSGHWGGATPLKFAYIWLRDGKPIAGATTDRHKISSADLGQKLRCRVKATNVAGGATAPSAAVEIPRGGA